MRRIFACCLLTMTIVVGCGGSKTVMRPELDMHGQRAYRHFFNGDLDKALAQYKRGYAAARKVDDVSTATRYLASVGRVYAEMGRHDSAALYLAKAHEEYVALADTAAVSRTAAALAVTLAAQGNGEAAEQWYRAASAYAGNGKDGMTHFYAVTRARMDLYLSKRMTDQAALDEAARYYTKKKDHPTLVTIYTLMGNAEFAAGNCAAAERHLSAALATTDKTKEMYRRSGILLRLAQVKFCLGDTAAGTRYYDRAKDCAPRGITIRPVEEIMNCDVGCSR